VDIGLLKRDGRKTQRGIKYIYSPVDSDLVRKILLKELNASCKRLREEINSL
jgi:predicted transcriptional regulator